MNEDKSVRYHRLKRRATGLSVALTAALLAALLLGGGSAAIRDAAVWLTGAGSRGWTTVALYAAALLLLQEILTLPIAFYSSFHLERRYGLSSESLGAWLRDHAKAFLLTLAFGMGAVQIVYATLQTWPAWWWLASAAAFAGVMVVLAWLFPVLLLPLFYRFRPLDRPALRARLEALSRTAGVRVLGVFEWGLGGRTRRANAALVGTGGTRRILLSDTLLDDYSDDEIEVILAHELAHHVNGDILKGLLAESLLLLAALAAAAAAVALWWRPLGLQGPADVAALPLLVLAGGAVRLIATPFLLAFSRRNERRADQYALELTGRPAAFISAMRRLAAQNLAEPAPSAVARWLFHSHPPIAERIEQARTRDDAASGRAEI